jgi:hypothetical protein
VYPYILCISVFYAFSHDDVISSHAQVSHKFRNHLQYPGARRYIRNGRIIYINLLSNAEAAIYRIGSELHGPYLKSYVIIGKDTKP